MTVKESSGTRIPCPIESGIWRVVAKALFKDKKAIMRELLSNASDAITRRLENEPDALKKIEITYTLTNTICEDWGTGIMDLGQFVRISVPSYAHVKRGKSEIGYFGVGKTSFVMQSQTEHVIFESANGSVGQIVDLAPDEEDRLSYLAQPIDQNKVLNHRGLRATILDVKQRLSAQNLADYIGEQFAPKIMLEKFDISVIDVDGTRYISNAPTGFKPHGKDPLFVLSDGTPIFGVLTKGKTAQGNFQIFRRGVKITDPLAAVYRVDSESYLLIDSQLPPLETMTAGRDSLQEEYAEELINLTNNYCEEHDFENLRRDTEITKQGNNSMAKTMYELFEQYKLDNPDDKSPAFLSRLKKKNDALEKQKERKLKQKERKKPEKKGGKGKKPGKKTNRKNKKRRTWTETETPANVQPDAIGDVILFVPTPLTEENPVQYDPHFHWFNIAERPCARKIVEESVFKKGLSRASKNIMAHAMVHAHSDNEDLSPAQIDRKIWKLIDRNMSGAGDVS